MHARVVSYLYAYAELIQGNESKNYSDAKKCFTQTFIVNSVSPMEGESSEDSFQSAPEEDGEETWNPAPACVKYMRKDKLEKDFSSRIREVSPKFGENETSWILANYKSFASAKKMLEAEECKNLTRRQSKVLEPILNEIIAKNIIQARSACIVKEIKCDQNIADWISESYDEFSDIKDLLDSTELDDLTGKQLDILEKVLDSPDFITPNSYQKEISRTTLLVNRLQESTLLEGNLCFWIVNTWLGGESLDEIFKKKELRNITRRKQKQVKAVLEKETSKLTPPENENDFQELLDFAKASNFELSESLAVDLTKIRGKKYEINKVIQALKKEKHLDLHSKFEILKFLILTPSETIKQHLLEGTDEYNDLMAKLKTLLAQYNISEEIASRIRQTLSCFHSTDDFNEFEDLTAKQSKALKTNLEPYLKSFLELKYSLPKTAPLADDVSGIKPRFGNKVLSTEVVKDDVNSHDVPTTSSIHFEDVDAQPNSQTFCSNGNAPKVHTLEESTIESQPDIFMASAEARQGLSSQFEVLPSSDQEAACERKDFQEINNPNLLNYKIHSANTLPLITCKEVSQGDAVVEKFSVRADHVKNFCNFDGNQRFYRDISSGLMIDFAGLNDYKMKITGLFGRSDNAKIFLKKRLDDESFEQFENCLENEGSGMYLIVAKNLTMDDVTEAFLYFFSDRNDDYDNANPKSRSIHFFRYITQLTKDIILLFDAADQQIMMQQPSEDSHQKSRCRKYQIKEQESQKEQVSIDDFNFINVCWDQQLELYASNVGLLIVKVSEKYSNRGINQSRPLDTASDFQPFFSLTDISQDADICEEFMEDYLSKHHEDRYQKSKELWEMKQKTMVDNPESKAFLSMLDFTLTLRLYEEVFTGEFHIINQFFHKFCDNEVHSHIEAYGDEWKKALELDFDVKKALTIADKEEKLTLIQFMCASPSPCIFILREVLEKKTGIKPRIDTSYEELLSLVESLQTSKVGRFIRFFQPKNKSERIAAEKQILDEQLQIFMSECEEAMFQLSIIAAGIFRALQNFNRDHITSSRSLSKYVSYKEEKLDRLIGQNIAIEKSKIVRQCFFNILQELQTAAVVPDPRMNEDKTQDEKLIKSITKYNVSTKIKYRVHYSTVSKNHRKTLLQIEKVSLRKEHMNLVSTSSVLESKLFTFGSRSCIETPLCEVVNIFCIDASLAVLLLNRDDKSAAEVYSLNLCRKVYKVDFGKRISLSDYDVSKRILCVYSERQQETDIHLYQFSENYKSHTTFASLDLKKRYSMDALQAICLQYSYKFLWVLEQNTGRILRLNNKNGSNTNAEKLGSLKGTTGRIKWMQMSPNGQCTFLTNDKDEVFPLMTGTCNLLSKLDYPLTGKNLFIQHELKLTLLAEKTATGVLMKKVTILGAQQDLKLQEEVNSEPLKESTEPDSDELEQQEKKHWIRNFMWMFVKFPCETIFADNISLKLLAVCRKVSETFEKAVKASLNSIQESLKATKKPSTMFTTTIAFSNDSDDPSFPLSIPNSNSIDQMGDFVRKLIGFTPLQIARCQGNEFLILESGNPMSLENIEDVFDLKDKIDLGLFEAIFNYWTGPVKVVSSMGKQSTGKSYLLNHLVGSSFNISGTRCTDGCWMTVEIVNDCLYVILDFEGLGSFERTDQDDMLLSLFSSSLSTITLFKTEQRLDRDTDQLFSKFNLGSDQLKGADKILQGTFMIIVKDVAESDIDDIRKEFIEKINSLLYKEKHNNFISKLYQGGFQINPFSPFQTKSFYNDIDLLREEIIALEPLFTDGHVFMDLMKLMLAKLAISDFTPVDRQQIDSRIKYLKNHLPNALKYGQLSDDIPKRPEYALTLLDRKNERVPAKWSLKLAEVSMQSFEMDDNDFSFVENSFMSIVGTFNEFMVQDGSNFMLWRTQLELFLEECLNNRCDRIDLWMNENVALWQKQNSSDYDDILSALRDSFVLEKNNLRRSMKFCDKKCSTCFIKCTRLVGHVSDHRCSTSHLCTSNCLYCSDVKRPCKHYFGHENDHVCKEVEHFCGKKCSFEVKNSCPNECSLMSNHDGDHMCSLKVHLCNTECSLENCTSLCQMDCLVEHEIHKCSKEQCMADCCVENCRNICSARDHFHGFPDLSSGYRKQQKLDENESPFIKVDGTPLFDHDHFCGNEHSCGLECEEDGYCEVSVEKQLEEKEEIFEGQRSTFKYKRKFTQIGKKLPCLQKIAAFEKTHAGDHSCTTRAKVHFCMEMCPTCENICDKPFNHTATEDRLHHTSHGNMTKCHFICNQEDFNVGEHKYVVGEQAVAEFCHLFCNSLGRGHIHVLECPGNCEEHFDIDQDHRRHESCKYGPDENIPKDEIWHSAYWEHIGFQDPCTGAELEIFEKCPYYCSAPNHVAENPDEVEDLRSYCLLDLWHAPVKDLAEAGLDSGTVSKDGHLYACHHETKTFHWVLTLDKSGSMAGCYQRDFVLHAIKGMRFKC